MSCALIYGCRGESLKVRKFCKNRDKFHPYFALITITFLQVLFINYILFWIENKIIIVTQNCEERDFFSFCTQNDSLLHFKISDHPSYRLYFSLVPPFWNLKKKWPTDLPTHPPSPAFMNTPLSRGENRLLLLGRAEPSNLPPRGNLSIFEEKQAANLQSYCTFNQQIFRPHESVTRN